VLLAICVLPQKYSSVRTNCLAHVVCAPLENTATQKQTVVGLGLLEWLPLFRDVEALLKPPFKSRERQQSEIVQSYLLIDFWWLTIIVSSMVDPLAARLKEAHMVDVLGGEMRQNRHFEPNLGEQRLRLNEPANASNKRSIFFIIASSIFAIIAASPKKFVLGLGSFKMC